jgi:hypothetical protein
MNKAIFYTERIVNGHKNWKRYRIYLLTAAISVGFAGILLWIFGNDNKVGQNLVTGCISGISILAMNWNRSVDYKEFAMVIENLEINKPEKDLLLEKIKTI